MEEFKIVIPGEPGVTVSEQRAAVWDNCRQKKCYVRIEFERQCEDIKFDGPISVELEFYVTPPRDKMHEELIGRQHDRLPHLSSLIRFITDAAKGILYRNEKTICSITAKKFFSINPRTEIVIYKKIECHDSMEKELEEYRNRPKRPSYYI
jgi:Holliday junction resolvase RusA-like endonuclease